MRKRKTGRHVVGQEYCYWVIPVGAAAAGAAMRFGPGLVQGAKRLGQQATGAAQQAAYRAAPHVTRANPQEWGNNLGGISQGINEAARGGQ